MNRLLDKLLDTMQSTGYVSEDNYEIVKYGLELVVMKAIICTMMLVVGIITKSVIEVMSFMIAYQPLRSYCGGYHAKSRIACILSSVFMLCAVISITKVITVYDIAHLLIAIMLISSIVIFLLAPVDTYAKPLDDDERKIFRKRSLVILAVIIVASMGLSILKWYKVLFPTALAVFCTAVLLAVGRTFR